MFSGVFAAFIGLYIKRAANDLERITMQIETAKREWEKTFDSISDFITIHDKDYNIIRANRATAERFNTTPQALIGKKCYDLFHCASEPYPLCPHKKTLETGEPASAELDDPYLWGIFLISIYPLINEQGEFYATVHIMKDITKVKKADQKIRDEAEVNKAVLTFAKLISGTVDEEAIIQEVLRIAPTLVRCDACVMFNWDDKQEAFLPRAHYGFEDSLVPVFKDLHIKSGDIKAFDEVKKQKTSLVIEDPTNSPLMQL